MLSLVLVVIIVGNVVLWSYTMNQIDWEKMQERVELVRVVRVGQEGARFTFRNAGSLTSHLTAIWVDDATSHRRYDIDLFINAGDTISNMLFSVQLPAGSYMVKIVTERGNIAILEKT